MVTALDSSRFLGTWWRTPEEDEPSLIVYLRDGLPLPPARGRHGFTLHADGRAELHGPGPTDRSQTTESRWRLDASGQLHVEGVSEAISAVASVDSDRLKLTR